MRKLIVSFTIYFIIIILLYLFKGTLVPACDTYDSMINFFVFSLHIVIIIINIIIVRKTIKDLNLRFIVNSGVAVFYLLMMYIILKFELLQVICNI